MKNIFNISKIENLIKSQNPESKPIYNIFKTIFLAKFFKNDSPVVDSPARCQKGTPVRAVKLLTGREK